MRYYVEGFHQERAVELGLDAADLVILRWFVDFGDTGRMLAVSVENSSYYWIDHGKVLEDLPVLQIGTQRGIGKRFERMVEAGVLQKEVIAQRCYYRFDPDVRESLFRAGTPVPSEEPQFPEVGTTVPGTANHSSNDSSTNIDNKDIRARAREAQRDRSPDRARPAALSGIRAGLLKQVLIGEASPEQVEEFWASEFVVAAIENDGRDARVWSRRLDGELVGVVPEAFQKWLQEPRELVQGGNDDAV